MIFIKTTKKSRLKKVKRISKMLIFILNKKIFCKKFSNQIKKQILNKKNNLMKKNKKY